MPSSPGQQQQQQQGRQRQQQQQVCKAEQQGTATYQQQDGGEMVPLAVALAAQLPGLLGQLKVRGRVRLRCFYYGWQICESVKFG